jgi:phthalate 4,5-dioxygenase oxygenase subunit
MLSREDNELLTRVGRGTPMGDLLRRYWMPFLFGTEIDVDGKPARVRLLGEDLIAFRDSSGRVGLVAEQCPHRRASLYFGRNEECGIRCIYHGWKFDVTGTCVDQPSEPDSSTFKNRVRLTSYPCEERCGFIWTYMGPTPAPPMPNFEWMNLPQEHHAHSMRVQKSNWLQALEGEFDQSHVSYLHSRIGGSNSEQSLVDRIRAEDRHPTFEVLATPYGTCIAAGRAVSGDQRYWRVSQHLMPFFAQTGTYGPNPLRPWRAWVPMDDEHVVVLGLSFHPLRPLTDDERLRLNTRSGVSNISPEMRLPPSSEPYGRYWPLASLENDFFQDMELQRTTTYSGITEFWAQDAAVQESMGKICDRASENLGSSDIAIIAVRKRLLAAVKALREFGTAPEQIANPDCYQVRADAVIIPANQSWFEATADRRRVLAGVNPDSP